MDATLTPAQRRYLHALASGRPHPITVLTSGSQWTVRRNLRDKGMITMDGGDQVTAAGAAAIACPDCGIALDERGSHQGTLCRTP